jgi:hypothetical protein
MCALTTPCEAWRWSGFLPERTIRTVNTDLYEVYVQRNGGASVHLVTGAKVFENVFPMVQREGDALPKPVAVDGRFTARLEVKDALGQGQGLVLAEPGSRWAIRAYPTRPYICVQFTYTNKSKSTEKITKLIPWSVESKGKGGLQLGPDSDKTVILEDGRLFHTFNDYAEIVHENSLSQWNLAAYNPVSKRSLIAGFLSNRRGYGQIRMERDADKKDGYNRFSAECVYDPPVELKPGESLESECLYLGVAEPTPMLGLQRYGKAVAVFNGIRETRPFLPHGWDSWSTKYHDHIDEASVLRELDVVDKGLKRYGWTHFAVDAGWEQAPGDWRPNLERFPHGMKWLADEIHLRGMKASLWLDPFVVPKNAPLAHEHPEWLVPPNLVGQAALGKDKLILDVTIPDAAGYVRALAARIGQEWGFDGLAEADFVYSLLMAQKFSDPTKTKVEVLQLGMKALREGLGKDMLIDTMTPIPINANFAQVLRIGRDCAPVWRSGNLNGPWGCVESMTNAIRHYYFAPYLYAPDPDCAFFGHDATRERWPTTQAPALTRDQSLAWFTATALLGGAVKTGDAFTDLDAGELAILRKLLPAIEYPAVPIDLFQDGAPRIWHLPLHGRPAGDWDIVAVFNWDDKTPQTVGVDFAALGLDGDSYYTVYDFWKEQYYGAARRHLDVQPPLGGVSLLGIRPYAEHPMLLASDRHFTQGAVEHTSLQWDAVSKRLVGVMDGIADTQYVLRVLLPESYAIRNAVASCSAVDVRMEGRVAVLTLHCKEGGPVEWTAQF